MARMFIRFAAGLVLIRPSIAAWLCGDDDSADDASDAQSVAVVAENTLVSPGKIGVPAGQEVTLKLENRDTIAHDLEAEGLEVEVIEGGSDKTGARRRRRARGQRRCAGRAYGRRRHPTITFMADEPGEYAYNCTIPGHRDAGMTGTLTVE